MNVLSVSMRQRGGGIANYATEIEAELRRLGNQVVSASHSDAVSLCTESKFDRVLMQFEIVESTRAGELIPMVKSIKSLLRANSRPTVIYHTILTNEILVKATPPLRPLLKKYQRYLLRWLSTRADIVVLNPVAVDLLAADGVRARYVPIGVYGSRSEKGDSILSPYHAEGRLLCAIVGHPYRFKRYPLAARAFFALDEETRRNARFAVVGGDRSVDEGSWEDLERELRGCRSDELIITGLLDEETFRSSLRDVDVALLPYEPLPTASAAVAMLTAARVPMIVSSSPAFRAVVDAGGAIEAPQWPVDGTHALRSLIQAPDRRAEMRRALAEIESRESLTASVTAMIE